MSADRCAVQTTWLDYPSLSHCGVHTTWLCVNDLQPGVTHYTSWQKLCHPRTVTQTPVCHKNTRENWNGNKACEREWKTLCRHRNKSNISVLIPPPLPHSGLVHCLLSFYWHTNTHTRTHAHTLTHTHTSGEAFSRGPPNENLVLFQTNDIY